MRKTLLIIALAIALICMALAGSALSAPPVASGTISGPNESGPYAFGETVSFSTSVSGLRGNQYPLVYVECVSVVDGTVLYGQLDHPDADFLLGGASSPWYGQRDDAACVADLYAYGGKAIVKLASTSFDAQAAAAPLTFSTTSAAPSSGRYAATIAARDDSFIVTQTKGKATSLWVSKTCYVTGQQEAVSAENLPVVAGIAGPFSTAGDYCSAYVWAFDGNPFDPISLTLTS